MLVAIDGTGLFVFVFKIRDVIVNQSENVDLEEHRGTTKHQICKHAVSKSELFCSLSLDSGRDLSDKENRVVLRKWQS